MHMSEPTDMEDKPYLNREIDKHFETLRQSMDVFESNTSTSLEEIKDLQRYTNGKVRKIIIALVLVSGIVIGQTFTNAHDIISLIISII